MVKVVHTNWNRSCKDTWLGSIGECGEGGLQKTWKGQFTETWKRIYTDGAGLVAVFLRTTPKAFANSSPGLLQPWETAVVEKLNAEGVRKFQPRVASTLGNAVVEKLNAEGVR